MFLLNSKRFLLLPILFIVGFGTLVGRALCLYCSSQNAYADTLRARYGCQVLTGQRGKIFDRSGQCLASNQKVFDVGVDLTQIQEKDLCQLGALANLLKMPLSNLEAIWNGPVKAWKPLKNEVPETTYKKICDLRIRGVYGNSKNKRIYLDTPSLGHVLGFVNKEGQPVCGIEQSMHFYLEGQIGESQFEVDGKRNPLAPFSGKTTPARDGYNIEVTLDATIQGLVAKALKKADEQYHPQSIQALVTYPHSGEILALVVYPGFDPNHYGDFPLENLKNRVVTDVYEPGSVAKALTVSAALDMHKVTEKDCFDCSLSSIEHHGRKIPLPKDWKPFNRSMSVAEILANSSNRGVAQIGLKLGAQPLFQYGRSFGFGASTQSGLAGETKGIFYPPEKWDGLTITRLPIGHAFACSLIQIHYAVGSIANRGKLMYPKIVRRIYDSEGYILRTFLPTVRRQVIQEKTAKKMCQLLTQSSNSKAYIPHYFVAAKTGTSQKIINGQYSHSQHVSSMSGFFPSQNPQIQITVTVDSPHCKGTAYGAQIASPIFKEIAEGIIAYLGIPPLTQRI